MLEIPEYTFSDYSRVAIDVEDDYKTHRSILVEQDEGEVMVLFYEDVPFNDPSWVIGTYTIDEYLDLIDNTDWIKDNTLQGEIDYIKAHRGSKSIKARV